MSQYKPTPKNSQHQILVGWDKPLQTYFIHVIDTSKDEDDDGRDVYWVGCLRHEFKDASWIMSRLAPYVALIAAEETQLYQALRRDAS